MKQMHSYKEMTIRRPPVCKMPSLDLNGKWLETLGFISGTLVYITYEDSCLTISTNQNTTSGTSVLMVRSKMIREQPRTTITLDGFILKRCGFQVGDRIVLHLSPNMIQITRITHFTTEQVA